jgi:hypothetical protein
MNAFMSRAWVHEHSESIGSNPNESRVAVQRLLKDNKRLAKFVQQNAVQFEGQNASVCQWLVGVVACLFERAGGRMRAATWEQVHSASDRVAARVPAVLPLGDGFPERARGVDRAQPHVLDEALWALFDREEEQQVALAPSEAAKIYLMMWVVTEVLDENWTPPADFVGETVYAEAAL